MRLDDIFAFSTPKFVLIENWRLGILNYSLKLLIVLYILGWEIIYKCAHLLPCPLEGFGYLKMHQPTADDCPPLVRGCTSDYRPFTQLPYCNAYTREPPDTPNQCVPLRAHGCKNLDSIDFTSSLVAGETYFAPTMISLFSQTRTCRAEAENQFDCSGKNLFDYATFDDEDHDTEISNIADIERYRLLVRAVYETSKASGVVASGDLRQATGYIIAKQSDEEQFVKWGQATEIPLHKDPTSSFPSLEQNNEVLSIELQDLLRLGGVTSPCPFDTIPTGQNKNRTIRENGAIVVLHIEFTNKATWKPWGDEKMRYDVFASALSLDAGFSAWQTNTYSPTRRLLIVKHGLQVISQVSGTFYQFTVGGLLTYFTTAIVLVASSTVVIDYLMLYALKFKKKYTILKYQPSLPFSRLMKIKGQLEEFHGLDDPKTLKCNPQSHVLMDVIAPDSLEVTRSLSPTELTAILMQFDMRLNRLDAMDDQNIMEPSSDDPCSQFLKKFEDHYWAHAGVHTDSSNDEASLTGA